MSTVYILLLSNGRYYIGSTRNFKNRLSEHNSGQSPYTRNYLPCVVVFHQEYTSHSEAIRVELWLKKLKSKSILEQIINDGSITKQF